MGFEKGLRPLSPFDLLDARYLDPTTGRFISRDPIGYGGGPNLHAYVLNDPVNGTDPSGIKGYASFSLASARLLDNNVKKTGEYSYWCCVGNCITAALPSWTWPGVAIGVVAIPGFDVGIAMYGVGVTAFCTEICIPGSDIDWDRSDPNDPRNRQDDCPPWDPGCNDYMIVY